MTQQPLEDARRRMDGAVQAFQRDLVAVRTGRASTGLVQNLKVDYYGTEMPIDQLAQISVGDARLIVIQPYDKTAVQTIVKAVQASDLGMNPNVDGDLIRLNVPPLTEERRKDIVKLVRKRTEEARVSVRNVRRDAQDRIRAMQKEGEVSEDDSRRALNELQKITDAAIGKVDTASGAKEKEVMQV